MAQILDLGKIRFNWAGTYNPATQYEYNDLVNYGPNLYAFTSATSATGVVPTNTGTWTVVVEGFSWRGLYVNGTLYYKNDIVTDNVSAYICTAQHTAADADIADNDDFTILALGQTDLPSQISAVNKVLSSDGLDPFWASTVYLTKGYWGAGQGQTALTLESAKGYTNAVSIYATTADDYAQIAFTNTSNHPDASTDFIAYTDTGDDSSGFIDLGITSSQFADPDFTITGPNDGYLFHSAPRGTVRNVLLKQLLAGVYTLTLDASHGWSAGDTVRIEGVSEVIDGQRVLTAADGNTVSFADTEGAVPYTATSVDPVGGIYRPVGNGDLVIATDASGLRNGIIFAAGGFYSNRTQMAILPDEMVHIEIQTESTSAATGALVVAGGAGITGALSVDGLVRVAGFSYIGTTAESFATAADLTNAQTVIKVEGGPYAQVAIHNPTASSSTDLIIYADNGVDAAGWIDMGITGSTFSQAEFGITGPNDGYIFFEAPEGTTGAGNLVLATGDKGSDNKIIFAAGGFADGTTQMEITPGTNVHIEISTESTDATTGAFTVVGGVGIQGAVSIAGLARIDGFTYIGEGAEAFAGAAELTNAQTVLRLEGGPYAQVAIFNPTPTASGDVIIYADNGNDGSGWIDVGITGSAFEQSEFGITGPNDGYVFYEAPEGTAGAGNLVIATGDKGTENKIIIAAGGFATGTEQVVITPDVNVHIEIPTPSTNATTGALTVVGGVGIVGDVNIQGSITFGGSGTQVGTQNLAVSDPMIFVGNGSITDDDDLAFVGEYKRYVADGTSKTVTNKALTENVATLTVDAAHGYEVGTEVVVAGVDATFNGTFIVTAVTANTLSYGVTAADVTSTAASGTVTAATIAKSTWTAFSKDNADGVWKLTSNITTKPTNQINYSQEGLVFDSVLFGNVTTSTLNVSTTSTFTGAVDLVGGVADDFTVTGEVTADMFNGDVTADTVTITGTPTANSDAATVEFVRDAIGGNWSIKTADYTIAGGESVFANTTAGPFNLTLPANPVANFDRIRIADIAGTWGQTPVNLLRNGTLIMGLAEDFALNVRNASVELIYSGPTYGWRFV